MSQAVAKFIEELSVVWPRRFDSERAEDQWVEQMTRLLRGYPGNVLKAAADDIIGHRKDYGFPKPAECVSACEAAAKRIKRDEPQKLKLDRDAKEGSYEWQYRLADELIACEMGRQAAREGWHVQLHDYIRRERRLPATSEIQRLKSEASKFDSTYRLALEGCHVSTGEYLPHWDKTKEQARCVALMEAALRKRESLRATILGDVA